MSEEEVMIGEGPAFERELPKEGSCVARVWKSFNVGLQVFKGSNPSPKVVVYFILPYTYTKGDYLGKRMMIKKLYTAAFGKADSTKPTYLRRDVQLILNRAITDKEVEARINLNKAILGKSCMVQIKHNNGYADIEAVMSLPDGVAGISPNPFADPADDYLPSYVTKLRENAVVQEQKDTEKIAEHGWQAAKPDPVKPISKEEQDKLLEIF